MAKSFGGNASGSGGRSSASSMALSVGGDKQYTYVNNALGKGVSARLGRIEDGERKIYAQSNRTSSFFHIGSVNMNGKVTGMQYQNRGKVNDYTSDAEKVVNAFIDKNK